MPNKGLSPSCHEYTALVIPNVVFFIFSFVMVSTVSFKHKQIAIVSRKPSLKFAN